MTEDEFLMWFDRYHDMVYRLAYSCLRVRQDAEDVTQGVFLKLLEGRAAPAAGRERTWLAQVTVNACRDMLRAGWRRRTAPLDETLPFVQQEESELFEVIAALPPKYRAAVHLHYYEGYTLEEIAQMLHVSPSAVSMRLHRARKLLKSRFKEDGYETPLCKNG